MLKVIKQEKRIAESDKALTFEYIKKLENKGFNPGDIAKYASYLKNIRLQLG